MSNKIPRRIIQTAKSRQLPLLAQAARTNLKCLNSEFEYLFFNDTEVLAFIKSEFPQYLDIFEAFRFPIQRFDFFRYLAVFRLGGFYLDLDVFLATGLHDLLEHECVLPFEELTLSQYLRRYHGMDWEIGNYAFGAAAGHPFLGAVIENCVRGQQDPDWVTPMLAGIPRLFRSDFYVLNTTGPGLLSRTFAENPALARDTTVLFPDDVCDPSNWHQFGNLGVHLMEGSWRTRGSYLRRRLGNLWEAWTYRKGLAASRRLGKTRFLPGNGATGMAGQEGITVNRSTGVSPASSGRVSPPGTNGQPGHTPGKFAGETPALL